MTSRHRAHLHISGPTPFFSRRVRVPRLGDVLATLALMLCSAVFFVSYIDGSYGLMAMDLMKQERDLLAGQSRVPDRRIKHQENLNRRISDTFLDLDLLEERSRILLGYVHADDLIIRE